MANLGIGRYLQNFESEVEVGPGNFKIVSSGSSLVRLADDDAESLPVCDSDVAPHPDSFDFPDSLDHEPAPGPSGVSTTSRYLCRGIYYIAKYYGLSCEAGMGMADGKKVK